MRGRFRGRRPRGCVTTAILNTIQVMDIQTEVVEFDNHIPQKKPPERALTHRILCRKARHN